MKKTYQIEICKHCGQKRGRHRAQNENCPEKSSGRLGKFPKYRKTTFELGNIKEVSK